MNRTTILIVLSLGCCLATGCATSKKAVTAYEYKNYQVMPELFSDPPRTVAILPFSNKIKESKLTVENWKKAIGEKRFDVDEEQQRTEEYLKRMFVRRAFYKHFSVRPFRDRELIAVDQLLKQNGIEWAEDLDSKTPKELAKILGVDALIYGEITHLNRIFLGLYSEVSVGCIISLYDARKDEVLWRSTDVEKNRAGGASLSLTGLATSILSATMNMRKIWVFRVADDLFRRMVDYLPDLEVAVEPKFVITAENTPLLEKPGLFGTSIGKKSGTVPVGQTVNLIQEADGWYFVTTESGQQGWINPENASLLGVEIGRPFDVDKGGEVSDNPTNAELAGLYDLQGMELFKTNNFSQARESFAKAVQADDGNPAIHFHLAWAYQMDSTLPEKERLDNVIKYLTNAVERSPENVLYHYNLGLALNEANQPEKALAEWKKCLELDPSFETARTLIDLADSQTPTAKNGGAAPTSVGPGQEPPKPDGPSK